MPYLQVLDEGNPTQDYCVQMDFQGAGVTVTRPNNNDYVVVTIPSAAAVSGWTDDGAIVRLTTAADNVAIGSPDIIANEKVRVVAAPGGVAIRVEGREWFVKTATAAAAATQMPSFVERFTASMWNAAGNAEVERDFDVYAGPSTLLDDETTARAQLVFALENNIGLIIRPFAADGASGLGVLAGDGALGTPSFAFINDPDSGMRSGGAGTLAFDVNGVQYFRIITGVGVYSDTPLIASSGLSSTAWNTLSGESRPAALPAGTTQDYAPANIALIFALSLTPDGGGTSALGGLTSGVAGRIIAIINLGAVNLTLNHQDGGSLAANRFTLPGAAPHVLGAGESALLWYDLTTTSWKLIAQS